MTEAPPSGQGSQDRRREIRTIERDEAAVKAAEAIWPTRYIGDLSEADWRRCYAVVDALGGLYFCE